MNGALFSVNRLCAGYGDHLCVADVSLDVRRGEILCLVGESGCGKTTLLRALLASPETRLFSGEIALEGASLSALSGKSRS